MEAWRDLRTLARYVLVGGASALVEFLAFNALLYLGGLPVLVANLAATAIVVAFSFVSHRRFTFRSRDRALPQVGWYVGMLAVSVLLNNALIFLFVVVLDWPPPLAKVLQLGLCFAWNFSCARLVVFARRPGAPNRAAA